MEKFLRSWRQDALNRGQHDAAIYIGDKALALTSECTQRHSMYAFLGWQADISTQTATRMLSGSHRFILTITTTLEL